MFYSRAQLRMRILAAISLIAVICIPLFVGMPAHAQQDETTINLVSDAVNPAEGETITYTAFLTCVEARPTGSVTFTADNVNLSPVAIEDGVASIDLAFAQGSHVVMVAYQGDSSCTAAHASISEELGAPVVSLTSSPNPSTVGQAVTFTPGDDCNVSGSQPEIEIFSGGTRIVDQPLPTGGSLTLSNLAAGTYTADVICFGATSQTITQIVLSGAAVTWCNLSGDGRLNSACGDRIAVYCNATAPTPDLDVWVIDPQSVGHELSTISLSRLMQAGSGGYVLGLGSNGVIFAGLDASGNGYAALQGGPYGGTAAGDWLKTFTCKAP